MIRSPIRLGCGCFRYDENNCEVLHRMAETARRLGDAEREHSRAQGEDENRVVGEYTPGSYIDDHDDTFVVRFLYAFWRPCEQRVAVQDTAPVNHSARITAENAGVSPRVRVVQVRQADRPHGEGGGGRDWQHRWVVRMHKVRQWYPSQQVDKVVYRGPYIKCPADKPLLGGEVVRGVSR